MRCYVLRSMQGMIHERKRPISLEIGLFDALNGLWFV